MTADHHGHPLVRSARANLAALISPLYSVLHFPLATAQWLAYHLGVRTDLVADNERLTKENLYLQARQQVMEELISENKRLRNLFESHGKYADRLLVAEIMGVDLDPSNRTMVINKGAMSGVQEGLPIVDGEGVIGQVMHVNPFSSIVLLITDNTHALPVQDARSGARAIAEGLGASNLLSLLYLPIASDLREGDILITSGQGGLFPAGYPVGRVQEVRRGTGQSFVNATVAPIAKMERNREVLIVWPQDGVSTAASPPAQTPSAPPPPLSGVNADG